MPQLDNPNPPVRGNLHLSGGDADLFLKMITQLTLERQRTITIAELLRECVRSYAEKLNIT